MWVYFITIAVVMLCCGLSQRERKKKEAPEQVVETKPKKKDKNSWRILLFVSVAVLVIVAGCRYHVGTDYKSYELLYKEYSAASLGTVLKMEEPILPLIGWLSNRIFHTDKAMFFFASLLTIAPVLISSYRESDDYVFITLLYIFVGCWHGSFNGIRQYLACAIVFCGRKFIFERKFLKYALVIVLASLCHRSAAVFILLYFIVSDRITVERMFLVIVGTVFLAINYDLVFELIGWVSDSEFVMTDYASKTVSIFRVLVGCCPALLALFYAARKKLNKTQIFYVYLLVANAAARIATAESAYLARLGAYTAMFIPLGLSHIVGHGSTKKEQVFAVKGAIVLLYFAYWMVEVSGSATLSEYEWFFGR